MYSGDLHLNFMTLRNFLSVGNDTIRIDFHPGRITAVLGENLDARDPDEARNGAGKSTILDTLYWTFYGKVLREKTIIIHYNARKNQSTTTEVNFFKGDHEFHIERGENPSRLLLFKKPRSDPRDILTPNEGKAGFVFEITKHSKAATNAEIEKIIGFDSTLAKILWALNSKQKPFLELGIPERRPIIESMLNFKILTERAEKLKEERKEKTKSHIEKGAELAATEAANRRVYDQIASLETLSNNFESETLTWMENQKRRLNAIIQSKPNLPKLLEEYEELVSAGTDLIKDNPFFLLCSQSGGFRLEDDDAHDRALKLFEGIEERVAEYRFEKGKHERSLKTQKGQVQIAKDEYDRSKSEYERSKRRLEESVQTLLSDHDKNMADLEEYARKYEAMDQVEIGQCPTCGQDWKEHSEEQHQRDRKTLEEKIRVLEEKMSRDEERVQSARKDLKEMVAPALPSLTAPDTSLLEKTIADLTTKIDEEEAAKTTAEAVLEFIEAVVSEKKAYAKAESALLTLERQEEVIRSEIAQRETATNPYPDQIESLKKNALVDVSGLKKEHTDLDILIENYTFQIELLTKPDSFLRKKIVEKWLLGLNHKLHYYVNAMDLNYDARFDSEMDIVLTRRGNETLYGNLSRGEQTRLNLAVAFSFQDAYEHMNASRINVMFLDELLDNGLDGLGARLAMEIIETKIKPRKHVFLITHRIDISDGIHDTMIMRKENETTSLIWV